MKEIEEDIDRYYIPGNDDMDIQIVFAVLNDTIMKEGHKQLVLDVDERLYYLKGGLNSK